ncbi:unnamed protein product [Pipistrellus nathusii]|uniref:ADP-ribosylation factor-like protein 9 n=1 Tax=Pipistrellus nathusii TaxID=59473 RepID=A0ABN9Z8L3_PIPNA
MERGKVKKKDKGKEAEKGKEDKEKRKDSEKEKTKDREKEKGKGKEERSRSKEEDKKKESGSDKEKEQLKGKEDDRRGLGKPVLEPPEKNNYILVLGLDGAGKTSVLYSLALNRVQHSEAPTQGFHEVCINTEHSQMEFLEIGGSEPFRSYWDMYVSRGLLLIFVVDSADHNRLPEAKKYLHRLIKINPIIPLVVFANKQDLKPAYHITDIHEALGLSDVGNDRTMFLFGTQVTENGSEIPSTMQDAKDLIAHLATHMQ